MATLEGSASERWAKMLSISPVFIASAEKARKRMGFLAYIFQDKDIEDNDQSVDLVRYDLIQRLGAGSYGTTFSASIDGTRVPTHVLKLIASSSLSKRQLRKAQRRRGVARAMDRPLDPDDPDNFDADTSALEREFHIGKLIKKRLTEQYCGQFAVCVSDRFYGPEREFGVLVFPLFQASTLLHFLTTMVYSRMRSFRDKREAAGYDAQPLPTMISAYNSIKRNRFERFTEQEVYKYGALISQLRQRLYSIQTDLFHLAVQLVGGVAMLHSKLIFHRDLKPANLLVNKDADLRIIDFGLACAEEMPNGGGDYRKEYGQYVVCPSLFKTTAWYRDPLALRMVAETEDERIEQNGKFDTYAVAKIIMRMFDYTSVNASGQESSFPRVYRSEFMPESLHRLLVDMTGESNYVPVDDRDSLSSEDLQKRVENFESRITMNEVATRLGGIVQEWMQENADMMPQ